MVRVRAGRLFFRCGRLGCRVFECARVGSSWSGSEIGVERKGGGGGHGVWCVFGDREYDLRG